MIDRLFTLKARGSSIPTEFRASVATFLTMAYILFANAAILSDAGVPFESAVACTAIAAGICCLLMGVSANFPLALASGMGLNAVIAYQVTPMVGSWQVAMGLVVLDGIVVLLLVLLGLREAVMHAIPRDLRLAIGGGIGLFIAFIGLNNAGIVIKNPAPAPPVTYGPMGPEIAVAAVGFLFIAFLMTRKVRGALIWGILLGTVVALLLGVSQVPETLAWPSFEAAFQADVWGALNLAYVPILLSLVMVDFFDTLGTVTAVGEQADLVERPDGATAAQPPATEAARAKPAVRIPGLRRILVVDSVSASIGGLFGVSSVTSYIESAAGVAEGGRTGLHTVFVGLFFLAAIFVAPIAGMVPAAATAPALVIVGFLMAMQIVKIDFEQVATAVPAFVTLVTIPLTYSISHGIGYGFISYVAIQMLSLRFARVHPLMYGAAGAFLVYFVLE